MDPGVHPNRFRLALRTPWGLLGLLLVLWAGGLLPDARSQHAPLELQPLSPSAQANGGIQFARAGTPKRALPLLKDAFAARPTYVHPTYGSTAYWLGEAYARMGDSSKARSTWYRGFHRLDDAGRFDPRLTDAYLRTLSRQTLRNERLQAVDAYVALLNRVGTDTSAAMRSLFRRRIAQIAPLMPDGVFARTVEGKRSAEPSTWTFRRGAGDTLRAWWRGLDPFPATPENERLEEHLTRLVHARSAFACPSQPDVLDARGTAHLRFGAPTKRRRLDYKDMEFFQDVFRFGVPIPPSGFPESEIWLYPQIDEAAYYLFAESDSNNCFEIARPNDLLPGTLKMQRSDTERGLNIAYSSLMAMRAIYSELALYHIDFSNRYTKIANYAGRQETKAHLAKVMEATSNSNQPSRAGQVPAGSGAQMPGAGQSVQVGSGVGQTRRVFSNPNLGLPFPTRFVTRMVSQAAREDEAAAQRRKENVPRQYTALLEDTTQLPVAVRTARFLTTDGTTRTEVYWGVTASDARLQPDEEETPAPSLVRFSAVRHNADRSQVQRRNRRLRLPAHPSQQRPYFVTRPVTFESTALHHLTMQWEQYQFWQQGDSTILGLGPKQRFTLVRSDSLRPLHAKGNRLTMSDVKVLSLPDTAVSALPNPVEQATPYPFRTLTAETPLLLSFEVYHLTYGADDRTHYSVSYEVQGETRRGWTRLFRGQESQRTSTTMTREGTSRRSEEWILLDLSEIERDEPQDVRVSVRVTDTETGSTVSRTLDFVLSPSGAP